MLAEPRRRLKYSVNPRGLDWSNDETKIGQKLMMKMGWKKGNALGAREDGSKEHIKVTTKSDRQGVGCTKQNADNWIAHQDDFNAILSDLNTEHSNSATDSSGMAFSLKEKSKSCRSRVHYEKFTKGKDLSCYNSTDISCIFGQRQSAQLKDEEQSTATADELASVDKSLFGVKTITSATTIGDYFAMKMAKIKHSKMRGTDSQVDGVNDRKAAELLHEPQVTQLMAAESVQQSDGQQDEHKTTKKKRKVSRCQPVSPQHTSAINKLDSAEETSRKKGKKRHKKCKDFNEVIDH
jgi:Pin2-interacting protein X1